MECEEIQNIVKNVHSEFMNFLEGHTVYETIPENMKVK
jgi:hypothetical protein